MSTTDVTAELNHCTIYVRDRYVDKLSEKATGAAQADSAVPVANQGAGAVRIHAAWNQTAVRTGRLSCSRPNLQQVIVSSLCFV